MKALTSAQGALCIAVALFVSLSAAHAGTIYVGYDELADFHSIEAAVAAAASGDTIIVATGKYTGPGARDIVIEGKTLTIRSTDPNDPEIVAGTVINCQNGDGLGHRFIEIVPDTGVDLTLAGLTVVNAADAFSGGVVLCEGGSLSVINCTFDNNVVQWWGGALSCVNSSAIVDGCTFTNNASTAMHGGAVFSRNSTVHLTHCVFDKNTGNAVQSYDSNLTITECTFESNVGREGGAISSYGTLDTPAHLSLAGCTFTANVAETTGGALHGFAQEATISACLFKANTAGADGGAVYNHRTSPSINGCAFVGNTAVGLGGAVANHNLSSPEIINVTMVNNGAASGGAIASTREGHTLISQSILWTNQATTGSNLYLAKDTQGTIEYSNMETALHSVHAEVESALSWGLGNLDSDPLFAGPLLGDFHLSSESPCVDGGDPNNIPAADATDLDGQPRLFGKTVDMGCYEYQGVGAVYRFWSPSVKKHFYTISWRERDKLITKFSDVWQFEGIAYYAFHQNTAADLVPVYRFWSPALGAHIWTIRESERAKLLAEPPEVWTDEGIAFYAYPAGKQPKETVPVYRFWSARQGYHFYTSNEDEKEKLLKRFADIWVFEGVAYYTPMTTTVIP